MARAPEPAFREIVDNPPPRSGCVLVAFGLALLANGLLALVGAVVLASLAASWVSGRAMPCDATAIHLLETPE